PLPGAPATLGEFRQLTPHAFRHDEGVIRTLDARPLGSLSIKEAHWFELNLLLTNDTPSNSLYAIQQLDSLSKRCQRVDDWWHSDDFKRETVLKALFPLVSNANDEVAVAALNCFQTGSECAAQI